MPFGNPTPEQGWRSIYQKTLPVANSFSTITEIDLADNDWSSIILQYGAIGISIASRCIKAEVIFQNKATGVNTTLAAANFMTATAAPSADNNLLPVATGYLLTNTYTGSAYLRQTNNINIGAANGEGSACFYNSSLSRFNAARVFQEGVTESGWLVFPDLDASNDPTGQMLISGFVFSVIDLAGATATGNFTGGPAVRILARL